MKAIFNFKGKDISLNVIVKPALAVYVDEWPDIYVMVVEDDNSFIQSDNLFLDSVWQADYVEVGGKKYRVTRGEYEDDVPYKDIINKDIRLKTYIFMELM